jgi:hypothetical protein
MTAAALFTLLLVALGGILIGGAISFARQRKPRSASVALGVIGLAVLGLAAWLLVGNAR